MVIALLIHTKAKILNTSCLFYYRFKESFFLLKMHTPSLFMWRYPQNEAWHKVKKFKFQVTLSHDWRNGLDENFFSFCLTFPQTQAFIQMKKWVNKTLSKKLKSYFQNDFAATIFSVMFLSADICHLKNSSVACWIAAVVAFSVVRFNYL